MADRTDMQAALQACVDVLLHDGVPTDPEHPKQIALIAAEAALASRPDAQADERGAFEAWAKERFPRKYLSSDSNINMDDYRECAREGFERGVEFARAAAPQAEAAQGVPVAINLEGLREKLLAPRQIVRDEDGWLTHSDFPICDEDVRADKLLEAFRIEAAFVSMEDDVSHEAYEEYYESGAPDCSSWTPTPPAGNGWVLLEIYDTEDGPYAMFGRDAYTAEQERKKENTRKLRAAVDAVRAERAAATSPDREQVGEDARRVDELSMLIRQLVHALRKAAPDNDLAGRAGDYLKRAGLQGSPLRVEAPDAPPSRECGVRQAVSVIRLLIDVARAAFHALDNSEEREGADYTEFVLTDPWYHELSDALGGLDALPEDKPGYTLGAAGKAEWALRELLVVSVPVITITGELVEMGTEADGIGDISIDLPGRAIKLSGLTADESKQLKSALFQRLTLTLSIVDCSGNPSDCPNNDGCGCGCAPLSQPVHK